MFVVMALLEWCLPRRQRVLETTSRWLTNFSLVVVDSVLARLLVPFATVAVAEYSSAQGWGLFGLIAGPAWLEALLAFILLDWLIYIQHVMTHKFPLLWAVHKVHHADRDIDVTTGFRFHPLEILFSLGYKLVCILLLGPSVIAVLLFEIVLNASSIFNHANYALPSWLDKILRVLIVTPDMHRVHHSTMQRETDSNYGFFLSVWDRLFQTYNAQPERGHRNMEIGLTEHQTTAPASLIWSLLLPFRGLTLSVNRSREN